MNPIALFEDLTAKIEDHFNLSVSIHKLLDEARNERNNIMADFTELKAAVAELKAAIEGFTVPTPVDDTADVDAVTADVKSATDDLKAKTAPATNDKFTKSVK